MINSPFYVLELSYKGTHYSGWQEQPRSKTIEGTLKAALLQISNPAVRVLASSRTDAGVHAFQQIVRLDLSHAQDLQSLRKSLNAVLPADIAVKKITECSAEFHPTYEAKRKVYIYSILNAGGKSPFFEEYAWRIVPRLNLALMRKAAIDFIGEHDFTYFCAVDSSAKSKIRKVDDVRIHSQGSSVSIQVLGKGFLKQMIRKMVGTLVEIGNEKRPYTDVQRLLEAARIDPQESREKISSLTKHGGPLHSGVTAPAQGLCLAAVLFDQSPFIKSEQQ